MNLPYWASPAPSPCALPRRSPHQMTVMTRTETSTTVLQNMWGRLQPAAGFSPRMPQREMRILLLPLHYWCMQSSYRRLPHHYAIGEPLFVTFRLHGGLPTGRLFPSGRLVPALLRRLRGTS